jgi:hypothetical protein
MKGIHPNKGHFAALAAIAFSLCAGGCRNPSSGVANPFLAPDRVPPPATRAILPGQAQPYYPGDPIPLQSGTTPPTDNATVAAAAQMPSADGNLTWTSPRGTAPVSTTPTSAPTTLAATTSAPTDARVVASAEPTVTIPADGDALRFALPSPPEPAPFTPAAPAPIAAPQQPVQVASSAAPPQGVMQATYEAPVIGTAESMVSSPWRTPQITQQSTAQPSYPPPPMVMQPFASQTIATAPQLPPPPLLPVPIATAPNSMDVRLRAVPSPEPLSPTPRIRIPGYDAAPPTVGSYDGFRPRTSMK